MRRVLAHERNGVHHHGRHGAHECKYASASSEKKRERRRPLMGGMMYVASVRR